MPPTLPATLVRIPRLHTYHHRHLLPFLTSSPHHHPHPPRRALTTSPLLLKRAPKPPPASIDKTARPRSPHANNTATMDPLDFTVFEAMIAGTLARLKTQLARLRAGGRNPEMIENLRVVLAKDGGLSARLGEVAQVVPRGRVLAVQVGEKEHLKAVLSALNNAPNSLTPTPSPTNPLELHIPLPPPTAESRAETLAQATQKCYDAEQMLKGARHNQKKKLRALELGKAAGPDLIRRAEGLMEKVAEKAAGEVKGLLEGAKKVL